jgi:hypothetical protein
VPSVSHVSASTLPVWPFRIPWRVFSCTSHTITQPSPAPLHSFVPHISSAYTYLWVCQRG